MDAPGPLITADELGGPVTLLDVRWALGRDDGPDLYRSGHIPGAAFVDLETDLADPPGNGRGRHPLPDLARFGEAMRRCGVRGDRSVVVYDDVAGTSAARAWWLLRYAGHRDVRVLDGGWSAWVAAGGDVERGEILPDPGSFAPRPGGMPVLEAGQVLAFAREGALVDVRAAERFRGEAEPVDPVAGHIPGAVNVPTAASLTSRGSVEVLKQRDELATLYAGMLGGPVGFYCGSGVTAAHGVLVAAVLGVEAALYPGSWSEWISAGTRPVAQGG
jgi:thiosulfate/3-mercaptopyruvate sulfurtransferase